MSIDKSSSVTPTAPDNPSLAKETKDNSANIFGNHSTEDTVAKLVQEAQALGQPKPPSSSIIIEGLAQAGGQLPVRGETPAERTFRLQQEKQKGTETIQQKPDQTTLNRKGQVGMAVGEAPPRVLSALEQKLIGRTLSDIMLAEVRGAVDFPYKPQYKEAQQIKQNNLSFGDKINVVSMLKESEVARVGRTLKEAFSLRDGGNEEGALNKLGELQEGDLNWGQNIPDGNTNRSGYWTALKRKLVTLETVMSSNVGRVPGYPGTRYFQDLWGSFQADSAQAIQSGIGQTISCNPARNDYLGFIEGLVSSPIIPWAPLMDQAPINAQEQSLNRMEAEFQGPSNAASTAQTLLDSLRASRAGDNNKAKELIESTMIPGAPGAEYAAWTAAAIDKGKVNQAELFNKVRTLYDILKVPPGQANSAAFQQALERYVTVNLLNGVESQLTGGIAPLEQVAYTMAVEQYIHDAPSLQTMESQPLQGDPSSKRLGREDVIKRLINSQARTLRLKNNIPSAIGDSIVNSEIAVDQLLTGIK